ncbi:MAG: integrase core domain-containing protein [Luteolibacter sp.]
MAGSTTHLPISCSTRPCPSSPTGSGPVTSLSFQPPPAGAICQCSSISVRAESSAGPWQTTCARNLVGDALKQALGSRDTVPDLIFHSDRGSQYGSNAYRELVAKAGMRQSMSARANPNHNARTESFIGTLKTEMLQDGSFIGSSDARPEISNIEAYYYTHRKHPSFVYQTPAQFEAKIHTLN